ncbi:MAG: Gfo/Idh/MocA family oxidoreductase [Candidatus Bathyarchaeia archaeon]
MGRKIGVGIIGAGIMGSSRAKAAKNTPETEVVAIADVVEERARSLADQVGAVPYTDFREMLRNERVEAVFVTTPDHLHKEPVIAASEAGKHLWIEKPLATNMDDAKEMMKAITRAQKAGAKVTVQFSTRWYPAYTAFERVVKWGYVGEPISIDFSINDRIDVPLSMWGGPGKSWAKHSSVADFLTCYAVDLVRCITGLEAQKVYARSSSKVLKFTPDFYQALVTFQGDFNAYLESNWILARSKLQLSEHYVLLSCSGGTLQYLSPNATFVAQSVGGGEIFFKEDTSMETLMEIQGRLKEEGIVARIVSEPEREYPYEIWTAKDQNRALWIPTGAAHHVKHHHGSQFKNFIYSILENQEPYVTAMDGYKAAEVVCAIKDSASRGETVRLSP